jgi:hypothetical protein
MNMVRIDAAVAAQQTAEPSCIQGGAGAEDAPSEDSTRGGEPRSKVRHHVHRISGHNEHRLGGMFQNCRHDFAKYLSIALKKLQPRFALLLPNTRAENNDAATRQILVAAGSDIKRTRERHPVAEIVCFRDGTSLILVDQHDLASHALHHQGVSCRGAHESTAKSQGSYLHCESR